MSQHPTPRSARAPAAIEPPGTAAPHLRLRLDTPGASVPGGHPGLSVRPPPASDVIDDWLALLTTLLRWRGEAARGVRDELESHLRERTRDLMLTGMDEPAAARQAIAELGDARSLADSYRRTRTLPARRFLMNASMFLLTGAALGLSILAVSSHPQAPALCPPTEDAGAGVELSAQVAREFGNTPSGNRDVRGAEHIDPANGPHAVARQNVIKQPVMIDPGLIHVQRANLVHGLALKFAGSALDLTPALRTASRTPEVKSSMFAPPSPLPSDLAEKRLQADLKEISLQDALASFAKQTGLRLVVRWDTLETQGASPDSHVSLTSGEGTLDELILLLNESLSHESSADIAVRSDGAVLEFASNAFFDRRETSLVSYDLSRLESVENEALQELIHTFVEPEGWRNNGGTAAWLTFVDRKMFVQAPKRYHSHIKWFLSELQAAE